MWLDVGTVSLSPLSCFVLAVLTQTAQKYPPPEGRGSKSCGNKNGCGIFTHSCENWTFQWARQSRILLTKKLSGPFPFLIWLWSMALADFPVFVSGKGLIPKKPNHKIPGKRRNQKRPHKIQKFMCERRKFACCGDKNGCKVFNGHERVEFSSLKSYLSFLFCYLPFGSWPIFPRSWSRKRPQPSKSSSQCGG